MAYIVNQDLINRVGNDTAAQLTADSGTAPDSNILDEVRISSEREVDSYLSRRFSTPIDTSADADLADFLKKLALDVAEYRIFGRRPPVSKNKKQVYDNTIAWLKGFVSGENNLPGKVTPPSTKTNNPVSSWDSNKPNMSNMRDYI